MEYGWSALGAAATQHASKQEDVTSKATTCKHMLPLNSDSLGCIILQMLTMGKQSKILHYDTNSEKGKDNYNNVCNFINVVNNKLLNKKLQYQ